MKLHIKYALLIVCMVTVIFACKKDDKNDTTPAPGPDKPDTPVVVTPKDSIVNAYVTIRVNGSVEVSSIPVPANRGVNDYALFSFDKMKFLENGNDSLKTSSWDLAFSNSSGIDLVVNWGGTGPDFWDVMDPFGGVPGDVMAVSLADTSFDAVAAVPAGAEFSHPYQITTAFPVSNTETGLLDHMEFLKTVFIFQLKDGRYVKFQYVSFYKGAPEKPTAQNDKNDRGYWTFKYYISKAGSKDLATVKK
jgi:hypothetical protein